MAAILPGIPAGSLKIYCVPPLIYPGPPGIYSPLVMNDFIPGVNDFLPVVSGFRFEIWRQAK